MTRYELRAGDQINVFTWFGKITMFIKKKDGKLVVATQMDDVEMPIDRLGLYSKHMSGHSRWSLVKRNDGVEDIEYVEVVEPAQKVNRISELKYFT